jgi:hypothetical protein
MEGKKRVLFICPAFFGYEVSITNAIIANGYEVDFFDERTSNNSIYKAVFRVKKDLLSSQIKKHYDNILNKIKTKKYSYFLLIKGEVVPEWFIIAFKQINPEAKLIYYTYDSFNNNNANSIYILKHFDKCYSFDFEDVISNPQLKLKHLFYTDEFKIEENDNHTKKHSISFVGTLHSARYTIVKNMFKSFNDVFTFFYMPAKWFFLFEKITKKDYRKISWNEVSFDKLSKKQVAQIFKESKSVLDIQRTGQAGLTMRTFEVLASGAILITTNTHIKQTDFYQEEKIVIVDDKPSDKDILNIKNKIEQPVSFNRDFANSLEKYSVTNWVKEFFE